MTKWFYSEQQVVKGPLQQNDLLLFLQRHPNPSQVFVWTRGQTEWISADRWNPQTAMTDVTQPKAPAKAPPLQSQQPSLSVKNPESGLPSPPQSSASELTQTAFEAAQVPDNDGPTSPTINADLLQDIEDKSVEKYKVQLQFIDQPLMTKDELMAFISSQDDVSQISIYDKHSKEWKEVYAFREIVEKLGLTRRKHPRVPILAQFMGSSSRHSHFTARVVTISVGGLGLTDVFDLRIGDRINGQMTSPHFYSPVNFEAEVTYAGQDGYVGFKFVQINDDALSLVTDYVNRFSQNQ